METIKLFTDFWNKRSRDIFIGCIASIEKHDLGTMRADIKPLIKYTASGEAKESKDFSIIPDVPVLFLYAGGFYIRPEYKRNDLVWVTFATFGISNALSGQNEDYDGSTFNRDSAAVVSGIAKTRWSAPGDISLPGLLIGHESGTTLIQVTDSVIKMTGNIEITGDILITGKIEADGEVTAMKMTAPVNLSTHIHPTGVGPSESPTPGT